jgi:Agenet domain
VCVNLFAHILSPFQFFDGFGWLTGKVTACNGEHFQVTYENGCIEENNSEELSEIMITPNLAKVEIGSRLAVSHPDEYKYYEATVTCERNEKRPLCLEYVNGGHEWVDLRQYKFRLLPGRTVSRSYNNSGGKASAD